MKPRPTTKIAGDWDDLPIPKPRLQGLGSWHTDVVPVKGGSVQVLHADGNWYCGKLTDYDAKKGRWHILFDDGDDDWYSLPDRDVRLLRERARGSWATCLQTHQIRYFDGSAIYIFLLRFDSLHPSTTKVINQHSNEHKLLSETKYSTFFRQGTATASSLKRSAARLFLSFPAQRSRSVS